MGVISGGRGGGDDRVSDSEQALSGFSSGGGSSSSSLLRSPESSLTDDDGEVTLSSTSEEEETTQVDGDRHAGGPLYELAPPLPVRAGLSKYYQGKSQSFTSLYNARCVEDLAKKTTPFITRMKLHRGHGVGADQSSKSRHAPGPRSKTIAKKTSRCSSNLLLSRASSTNLLHSSGKPPAHQSKK
ncbi:hypothetical protein GUJ93_ZPchr0006g45443 [Zizania palustris]|uniref:Oxidative stress 3 n=1 Tax=Zizania palustris TaxID=103762 RepID=A0A8J5VWX0_ZIZPA|nr:hypothetical protein GUJ93_ZPchr0006g45443 [Zizania palustris]